MFNGLGNGFQVIGPYHTSEPKEVTAWHPLRPSRHQRPCEVKHLPLLTERQLFQLCVQLFFQNWTYHWSFQVHILPQGTLWRCLSWPVASRIGLRVELQI